ncbi:hypothetical protein C8R48DRAFT_340334, partial [Suillus tomentosus]
MNSSGRSVFCHLRHLVLHDLPYSEVTSILQIELSQVEKWAICVIRTGLAAFAKALADHSISTHLPLVSAYV